jgi:5-methylcytosine-specific restriction endonuclease McrA
VAESDSSPVLIKRKQAIKLGRTHYFTGKPCRRGHVAIRFVCNGRCILCSREKHHEDKHKYKQRDRDRRKVYYFQNLEQQRADGLARYHADRKTAAARAKRYRLVSPKKDEYCKRWKKENKEACNVHKRNRVARTKAGGKHTAADIKELFRKQRGKCICCRASLEDAYHVDHIQPLARGGSNEKYNLQLLCPKCNHEKWALDPIEFMQERGILL